MTDYEMAMIKLKLLELTQRQALLSFAAYGCAAPNATAHCEDAASALVLASEWTAKLIAKGKV